MSRGAVVPVSGGGVLAGGLLPGDVSTDRSYRVDPSTGRVSRLGNLAVATHDVGGADLAGAPTVLGGGNTRVLPVVQRLGRDGHWRLVGRLPSPRADLTVVQDGARALVVGGYDGLRSPNAVLATSRGRRFTTAARLPAGVRYAAVAVLGDSAWVFGGEENGRELRRVYRIDLGTGDVRRRGRMPRPLGHAAAVAVGDRVLLMGGRTTPDRPSARMWWFDTAHRTWRRAGRLPYPVADAPALATASGVFLLGGETPNFTDRVVHVTWRAR
jgi:N-acetylneuraminic acid mutarotase